jgi:hypothetical protein
MKKIITIFLISAIWATTINSTDCPEPKEVPFQKLMNPTFAKDYQLCPIPTKAEFFSADRPKAWTYPPKVKNQVVFQCVAQGDQGKAMPLSGEVTGEFIVLPKDKSDLVFELKKGDKVKITGVTWVEKGGFGVQIVYLLANTIERDKN